LRHFAISMADGRPVRLKYAPFRAKPATADFTCFASENALRNVDHGNLACLVEKSNPLPLAPRAAQFLLPIDDCRAAGQSRGQLSGR